MGSKLCSSKISVNTKDILINNNKDEKVIHSSRNSITSYSIHNELEKVKIEDKKKFKKIIVTINKEGEIADMQNKSFSTNSMLKIDNQKIYYKNEFIKGNMVGLGRFGPEYTGLCVNSGDIVTIKVIKPNINNLKYIDIIQNINHRNINKYYTLKDSYDSIKNELYVITEFCNWGSINIMLKKYGYFNDNMIKLYTKQILEVLSYLHEMGIIYKNLKTSNILVDSKGVIRLIDILIDDLVIDYSNSVSSIYKNDKEIPYWISPYLLKEKPVITPNVDIWSLGCIILEMMGKRPIEYNFKDSEEFIDFLVNTEFKPSNLEVSKELKNFLDICFNNINDISCVDLLNHEYIKNKNVDENIFNLEIPDNCFEENQILVRNNNKLQNNSGRLNSVSRSYNSYDSESFNFVNNKQEETVVDQSLNYQDTNKYNNINYGINNPVVTETDTQPFSNISSTKDKFSIEYLISKGKSIKDIKATKRDKKIYLQIN